MELKNIPHIAAESPEINKVVLMSGADFFQNDQQINPYYDSRGPIDVNKAKQEHAEVKKAFESAGIIVLKVDPPENCQDGVYTANWALIDGDQAIMSRLPNARKAEEAYAENVLRSFGKKIIKMPGQLKFSGQGDSLPCGDYIFCGTEYRTDAEAHKFIAKQFAKKVISLTTVPELDASGNKVVNKYSKWPDSRFYDIDLALSVIRPNLIAWCPEAFTEKSRQVLHDLDIQKIEVSREEAVEGYACNLVSTGSTVIMSANAPNLEKNLNDIGIKTITPDITELSRGGGYIRCTSLTMA